MNLEKHYLDIIAKSHKPANIRYAKEMLRKFRRGEKLSMDRVFVEKERVAKRSNSEIKVFVDVVAELRDGSKLHFQSVKECAICFGTSRALIYRVLKQDKGNWRARGIKITYSKTRIDEDS